MDIRLILTVVSVGIYELGTVHAAAKTATKLCSAQPLTLLHGKVISKNKHSRALGSKLLFSCDKHYKLVGPKFRVCTAKGWSRRMPRCKATRHCSSRPFKLPHGTARSFDKYPRAIGSTIFFKCDEKYRLVGAKDMVCTVKGWSKRTPRCKVRKCLRPRRPENGRVLGNNFTVGAEVAFFCYSGLRLFGSQKRTCQLDGRWSGSVAICDDGKSHCPNPGIPDGAWKHGRRYNMGSTVNYHCGYGLTLRGSTKRRCQANGNWSGVAPVCVVNKIPPIGVVSKQLKDSFATPLMNTTCSSRNANCQKKGSLGRAFQRRYKEGLDLIFVLDASSSVSKQYFNLGLELMKEMVRMFGIDYRADGTQIACVSFGTSPHLEFVFGAASVSSTPKALEKISKIKFRGGATATRKALDMVRKDVLAMARKNSKKAMMFITDGNSNVGGSPASAATRLQMMGVEIYVIGVGEFIKQDELKSLASTPYAEHVFRIAHSSDIQDLKDSITDFAECGRDWTGDRARVVGGKFSEPGKWPWALLLTGPVGMCGATLIDKRWALTAAHCIVPNSPLQLKDPAYRPPKYTVYMGLTRLEKVENQSQAVKMDVENAFVHQNYVGKPSFANDIALLKLAKQPRFKKYNKYIQRVCLPDKTNFKALKKLYHGGIAMGWGNTEKPSLFFISQPRQAQSLKEVYLPFVDSNICNQRTVVNGRRDKGWFFDGKTMFCAGNGKGVNDTCQGDSGGPLVVKRYDKDMGVHRWYQVGITSWGAGCARENEYAYLTRVTAYLEWIKTTMKRNKS